MSGFRHKNLNSSTAVRLLLTTGVLVYGFLALLGVDGRLQPKLSAEGATQIELSTLGGKKLDLPSDMPCSDAAIKLYDMLGSQFRVGGKIVGGDQQMDIDSWLDDKNKNPFMVLHDERLLGEKIAELNPPAGAAINVIARHLDENERDLYFLMEKLDAAMKDFAEDARKKPKGTSSVVSHLAERGIWRQKRLIVRRLADMPALNPVVKRMDSLDRAISRAAFHGIESYSTPFV